MLLFLQQHPPLAVHIAQSPLQLRTSERPVVLEGLEQLQAKGRRHDGQHRILVPAKGGLTVILDRVLHEHVLAVEHARLLHPLGALTRQTLRDIHARVDVQRRVLLIAQEGCDLPVLDGRQRLCILDTGVDLLGQASQT